MKVKVISGVLIFSLALNLAVIGTFVYKRFTGPDPHLFPRDRGGRMAFLNDMEIEDAEREKMIELFREFRKINRATQEEITPLEDKLFETLQNDSSDLKEAHEIMKMIGEKKLALSKNTLNHFLKVKSFLTPKQQGHFYRMLIKNSPRSRLRKPKEEIFKDRQKRINREREERRKKQE